MSEKSTFDSIRAQFEQMNEDLENDPTLSNAALAAELERQEHVSPDPDGLARQAAEGFSLLEDELEN